MIIMLPSRLIGMQYSSRLIVLYVIYIISTSQSYQYLQTTYTNALSSHVNPYRSIRSYLTQLQDIKADKPIDYDLFNKLAVDQVIKKYEKYHPEPKIRQPKEQQSTKQAQPENNPKSGDRQGSKVKSSMVSSANVKIKKRFVIRNGGDGVNPFDFLEKSDSEVHGVSDAHVDEYIDEALSNEDIDLNHNDLNDIKVSKTTITRASNTLGTTEDSNHSESNVRVDEDNNDSVYNAIIRCEKTEPLEKTTYINSMESKSRVIDKQSHSQGKVTDEQNRVIDSIKSSKSQWREDAMGSNSDYESTEMDKEINPKRKGVVLKKNSLKYTPKPSVKKLSQYQTDASMDTMSGYNENEVIVNNEVADTEYQADSKDLDQHQYEMEQQNSIDHDNMKEGILVDDEMAQFVDNDGNFKIDENSIRYILSNTPETNPTYNILSNMLTKLSSKKMPLKTNPYKHLAKADAVHVFEHMKTFLSSRRLPSVSDLTYNTSMLSTHSIIRDIYFSRILQTHDADKYIFAAFQTYFDWLTSQSTMNITAEASPAKVRYSIPSGILTSLVDYIHTCYINNHVTAATRCMDMLLIKRIVSPDKFFLGTIIGAIHTAAAAAINPIPSSSSSLPGYSTKRIGKELSPYVVKPLNQLKEAIKHRKDQNTTNLHNKFINIHNNINIHGINNIIRVLGKYRLVSEIFDILDWIECRITQSTPVYSKQTHIQSILKKLSMKKRSTTLISDESLALLPNDETYEFLANALVANVQEDTSARAMKELPVPNASVPEIITIGRSNVGKSSLVNFIVNRKAIASTSATPGHTKKFHFFSVNKDRHDLPQLCLVDVPGLGFADVSENSKDSWRSLIERYLIVRENLAIVLHLVDSRHGLTTTDYKIIELMTRAFKARVNHSEGNLNKRPLTYAIVLTKADYLPTTKPSSSPPTRPSELERMVEDIESRTIEIRDILNQKDDALWIVTSAKEKIGRDDAWRLLRRVMKP